MNSIAFMKPRTAALPSAQAAALKRAFETADMSQAAVAKIVGVTPAAFRQWIEGERPVPIERAEALGRQLGIDPRKISLRYAQVHPPAAPESPDQQLRDDLLSTQLVLFALASSVVRHRPVEAVAISEAIQNKIPKPLRDRRFVSELIAILDLARDRSLPS